MTADDDRDGSLLEREADFWNRHEEVIETLYERPHDWRFAPEIADRIVAPKYAHVRALLARHAHEVESLLDIGCGNGWFCHGAARMGIRAFGVDLSEKKVETARARADEAGLSDLCTFYAGDATELALPEKVDLLTAQGSLHHFPDLEQALPRMVERHLRPGGLMLFVEPNHEGMPPAIERRVLAFANHRLLGRLIDKEFYYEVSGRADLAGAGEAVEGEELRGESPAGTEFLGEEPDMGAILKTRYECLDERYFLYFLGHLANVAYVYMRSHLVRGLFRLALPVLARLDAARCRDPRLQPFAEEGAWLLRAPGPE